jgi:hypothetical protein
MFLPALLNIYLGVETLQIAVRKCLLSPFNDNMFGPLPPYEPIKLFSIQKFVDAVFFLLNVSQVHLMKEAVSRFLECWKRLDEETQKILVPHSILTLDTFTVENFEGLYLPLMIAFMNEYFRAGIFPGV